MNEIPSGVVLPNLLSLINSNSERTLSSTAVALLDSNNPEHPPLTTDGDGCCDVPIVVRLVCGCPNLF